MPLADTTVLAAIPTLATIEAALKALDAEIVAVFPAAAASSNVPTFLTALVAEVASLANPDPSTAANVKADIQAGVDKAKHLFGTLTRDLADAVDPTVTADATATGAVSPAPASSIPAAAGKTS
jgi:hypothetical protein